MRFYTDVLRLAVQHDADLERLRKAPGAGDFQGTKQDELTDARDNATAGIACLFDTRGRECSGRVIRLIGSRYAE